MHTDPGFVTLSRAEWARLRAATPLTLTEADLDTLRGLNENLAMPEVEEVYLPLSRLLNLYVTATQQLHRVTGRFLGHADGPKIPYVIGLAGSVAVGKSTTARILQALLSRWPDHPRVDLVTTDGFLFPNTVLEARGLMTRKGFPESYDQARLVRFVREVKSGSADVSAPLYSHLVYDIVPDRFQTVSRPDILILEGLNVLQRPDVLTPEAMPRTFVSDYFDFSIYVDADEALIRQWFLSRFQRLRETAFRDRASYFHRYASLSDEEAIRFATGIWEAINGVNLRENIAPTRDRADLILEKSTDHAVQSVRLRER